MQTTKQTKTALTALASALLLALQPSVQAATINYVGSIDTVYSALPSTTEVNYWLTPSTSKSYDIDSDNIYGTFAAVSWNNWTNYTGSTISYVNVPDNVQLDNLSGFSAQVDDLAGACGGNVGSGVAVNPAGQSGVYMLRANAGNSVLYTNGSNLSISWMWHTFQVNSNLTGKTLRVGVMSYCYGQALTVNPHVQDAGKGIWIAQAAGGAAKSVVAPVPAGWTTSGGGSVTPAMTFFDIVDAQPGDQYKIYVSKTLFGRSNPQAYFGAISFDVSDTPSVPATKPFINTFITSGYINPSPVFGTPNYPNASGGTNFGYTGVIRTNCNFRLGALAGSATPATYQWFHAGSPISNATNSVYEIVNATLADSGNYQFVASNIAGAVTSQVYSVTVVATNVAPQVASYRAQAFATPGLYAFYGFDNGAKDMKGINDGTFVTSPSGGAQIGTGFGSAGGQFDGTGSEPGFYNFGAGSVQVPYDPAFDFNNANQEGTVAMWVRPDWVWTGSMMQSFLIANGTNGNVRWGLNVGRTKSGFGALRYDAIGAPLFPTNQNFSTAGGSICNNGSGGIGNSWYMLTAVFKTNGFVAYCNGVPMPATSTGAATNLPFPLGSISGAPLTIGALDAAGNNNWSGGIDEIAIYTNALSDAQVKALFNAGDVPYAVTQPVGGSFAPGDIYTTSFVTSNNWDRMSPNQNLAQPSTTFVANNASYQWSFNGTPIAGANSTAINFNVMDPTNAGTYLCIVTNVGGSITSSPAIITVAYPTLTSTQPASPGGNATISWPSSYTLTGWYLEESPSLQPPTWTPIVTNGPVLVPATNSQDFFRLVRPY
jgi:hypothetical protein